MTNGFSQIVLLSITFSTCIQIVLCVLDNFLFSNGLRVLVHVYMLRILMCVVSLAFYSFRGRSHRAGVRNEIVLKSTFFSNVVAIIEFNENEENQVTRDIVENWSVEEQAMELDLNILQQVEDLERRVASASLQVKVKLAWHPVCF